MIETKVEIVRQRISAILLELEKLIDSEIQTIKTDGTDDFWLTKYRADRVHYEFVLDMLDWILE